MFGLMKLGLHFTHSAYGALDPMVLELIRTERMLRNQPENKVAEPIAVIEDTVEARTEDVREAA